MILNHIKNNAPLSSYLLTPKEPEEKPEEQVKKTLKRVDEDTPMDRNLIFPPVMIQEDSEDKNQLPILS